MLSHVILGISDIERAVEFYDAVLGLLGYERRFLAETGAGYGMNGELGIDTFWLTKPIDRSPRERGQWYECGIRCSQSKRRSRLL